MSDEIHIVVDKAMIERVVYWIIILILAGLLAWCFFSADGSTDQGSVQQASNDANVAAGETTTAPLAEPEVVEVAEPEPKDDPLPSIDETCSDKTKNQDETDVDCGGVCTTIKGEFFYDDACHKEEQAKLSGDVLIKIDSIKDTTADSGFAKVEELTVTVTNGKSKSITDPYIFVYVKGLSGVYLNQFGDTSSAESTYAEFADFGTIKSGESVTRTFDGGSYVFEQTGYSKGDDFKITVELFDEDDDKLDSATKTVKV